MRKCLFCDSTDLTLEHVWPDWVSRALQRRHGARGDYTVSRTRGDAVLKQWKAKTVNQKARAVCAACNGGWLSELETLASQVLTPLMFASRERRPVTVEHQVIIAAWVTKMAMLFETVAEADYIGFYTATERRAFSRSLEPPANALIWLAHYRGRRWRIHGTMHSFLGHVTSSPDIADHVHFATFCAGELAFQITARRRGGSMTAVTDWEVQTPEWAPALVPIWPSVRGDLLWRPPDYLDDRSYREFAARFRVRSD